jgi:hypothetical protein
VCVRERERKRESNGETSSMIMNIIMTARKAKHTVHNRPIANTLFPLAAEAGEQETEGRERERGRGREREEKKREKGEEERGRENSGHHESAIAKGTWISNVMKHFVQSDGVQQKPAGDRKEEEQREDCP